MPKTNVSGMESFDHLTDKTQRFLLMMDKEESRRRDLLETLDRVREERDELLARQTRLEAVIADLESRRSTFDDKVTTLLDALDEFPLREIS